jgi:rubrerythrin
LRGPTPENAKRGESMDEAVRDLLREARRRERIQTAYYRRLTGAAEDAEDPGAVERLNELLADEQHHLSRITARLLEMGDSPPELPPGEGSVSLKGWESEARAREAGEVAFYKAALARKIDGRTREILQEILESERRHREELGGKCHIIDHTINESVRIAEATGKRTTVFDIAPDIDGARAYRAIAEEIIHA